MALVLKDRVKQTTTTTGTGSIVLNGNIDSFQTFAAALTDGDTTYYGIFEPSTNEYEIGLGTWTESSATLARTTVLESSNSGSAVSLTAQAEVFITQPAEKSVFLDANGSIPATAGALLDSEVTNLAQVKAFDETDYVSVTGDSMSGDLDMAGNKVLFGNVYSTTGDLPSASTYHGMFAHVHGTGKGYFAHAGNWVELANQADVTAAVNALVDSAPGTLDTLNELAAALGDDANFSTTVTNSIATKLPLSGGAMTGAITTNSTFDGRDVATDGAKLDGIEAGATADQTNAEIRAAVEAASDSNVFTDADHTKLNGIEAGATTDQTAAQILTAIKTVDGSGSGLDADTVDGIQASSFLRSDANDTMTGRLIIDASTDEDLILRGSSPYIRFQEGTTDKAYIEWNASGYLLLRNQEDGSGVRIRDDIEFTPNGSDYYNIWHANNDGSGSGLDADTVDGVHESTFMRKSANSSLDMNNNNITDVEDIYLQDRIYHDGDTDTYMQFNDNQLNVVTGGTNRLIVNNTGVRLGDSGNGYFQPVSGSYGSVQIDGGSHGGWEGYSIGGRVVFMHDNSSSSGIYNDVNNEWMVNCTLNGAVKIYYNGSERIKADVSGALITGNLYTTGSVAEDYDALSGTSPTCNVDNAGAFSLTMSGNTTFTFSGADSGYSMGFIIQLTGNGSTVTWPSSVKWAGGTAPDAPASGETDILVFHTRDGGSNWYGVLASDAAA
jgi:hypothetical protein